MLRPSDNVVTHDVPPLALRAAFNPRSVNLEKRTVDLTWSTGARILRGYYDKFYEELSLNAKHVRLARLNNGGPLLDGHPTQFGDARAVNVRGVVVSGTAKTTGKEGTCTVRFAKADVDQEAEVLFQKVQDGIVHNVSVGYRIYRLEKSEEFVDKVPIYRATDWEPFEISMVSAGEDDGAGFRSADSTIANPCQFIARGVSTPGPIQDADLNLRLRLLALSL
jgi:hypothetical protein